MSFEIADLCKFYFNITDPNDNKAFEHSKQVRKLNFEGGKGEEKCLLLKQICKGNLVVK